MTEQPGFASWAILELMGHRRIVGFVTEQEIAGAGFLRIDCPDEAGAAQTQYYSPSSVYAMTPVTEEVARAIAKHNRPEPVHRWELPATTAPATSSSDFTPDDTTDDPTEEEDTF